MSIRSKPDLEAFLGGGAATRAESPATPAPQPAPAPIHQATVVEDHEMDELPRKVGMLPSASTATIGVTITRPEPTVSKLFRLRWDTCAGLKLFVAQQTAETGRRVTEAEVVEALLRGRLKRAGVLE